MAILRSIVLFLFGAGAAAGMYMSGVAQNLPYYFSQMGSAFHGNSDGYYEDSATVPVGDDDYTADDGMRPVVLNLSEGNAGQACPVRYLVRNNSGRAVELGIDGYGSAPVRVAPGKALYPDDGVSSSRCPLVRINVQEP